MTTPRVLGLDPSLTATGVALPDGDLETIRPGPAELGDHRLLHLHEALVDRLDRQPRPTLAVVEDLPLHARAAGLVGMAQGVIRLVLVAWGVPTVAVPPATLKVYATGSGRATKADMRVELLKRTGLDVRDDNQVDAAWLRLLGLDLAGHPELDLPKTHRRALAKLPAIEEVIR